MRITASLVDCEHSIHVLLAPAPKIILQGQTNISNWQQRYQLLTKQWQQIQQILILLTWLYKKSKINISH